MTPLIIRPPVEGVVAPGESPSPTALVVEWARGTPPRDLLMGDCCAISGDTRDEAPGITGEMLCFFFLPDNFPLEEEEKDSARFLRGVWCPGDTTPSGVRLLC